MFKNPYETEKPVEVPDFMNKDDDSIDMSKIILNEDEFDEDEYYDDEDDKPRLHLKKELILPLVIGGVSFVIIMILLISLISKSAKYNTLQNDYDSLKSSFETKENRYNSNIDSLNKQIDSLKVELEEAKFEIESLKNSSNINDGPDGDPATDVLAPGTYYLRGNYIRTGPGFDYGIADYYSLPSNIKVICIVPKDSKISVTYGNGTKINILEVKKVGTYAYWGRIGEGLWICLRNNSGDNLVDY